MMKKVLFALAIVLALPMFALADHPDHYTFDEGYREMDSKGNVYYSDAKEIIFVCGGRYISNNDGITCLKDKDLKNRRAKIRTARYSIRVNGVLTFIKKVMSSDASANKKQAEKLIN
jgi:hypothetical protein